MTPAITPELRERAGKDRPIIFSAPMVRALIEGRKTQTRRILKPQPYPFECQGNPYWNASGCVGGRICISDADLLALHRYRVGDRLWVRERAHIDGREVNYATDYPGSDLSGLGYRPSTNMPRWASRLTLEVTEVRVERLGSISEEDAKAEGVDPICDHGVGNQHLHTIAFQQLWDRLHGRGASALNPWVAAISFRAILANIDAPPATPLATGEAA